MNTETITGMYQELGVDKDVLDFGNAVEKTLKKRLKNAKKIKSGTAGYILRSRPTTIFMKKISKK